MGTPLRPMRPRNPVPRGTHARQVQPSDVLYEGRADIVVAVEGCSTEYMEAFCLFLRNTHGIKARPGTTPRYSKAWPKERVDELYAAFEG